MYHKVTDAPLPPSAFAVTARHFAEHLAVLASVCRPVRLPDLARAPGHQDSGLNRAVAVSFDDGYADALHLAKPLLARRGIPATIFVTTGYVGHPGDYWWDAVSRLIGMERLPRELRLTVSGRLQHWDLARFDPSVAPDGELIRASAILRDTLRAEVHQLLRPLAERERRVAVDQLLAWAGDSAPSRAEHRQLSLAELRELAGGDLIEIGSHTVTHADLRVLPLDSQRAEIAGSKSTLEAMIDRPVSAFTYPFGSRSPETVELVKEAGYAYACTAEEGFVVRESDPFLLPRLTVEDGDGEDFARWLSPWLEP